MEHLCSPEVKFDAGTGEVTGYAAVFGNIDDGGDKLLPGAFSASLKGKATFPMLYQHDMTRLIGVWDSVREDSHGLAVAGRISDTTDGRDVRTLARDKALTGLSIGYFPADVDYETDGTRLLKAVDLVEASVVTIPMNRLARISSIKSALGRGERLTRSEFEFVLRDVGVPRRAAKRLLDGGFAALSTSTEDIDELARQLRQLHEELR